MPTLKEVLGTPNRKAQVDQVIHMQRLLDQKPVALLILAGQGNFTWSTTGRIHPMDAIRLLDAVKNEILQAIAKEELKSEEDGELDVPVPSGSEEPGTDFPGDTGDSGQPD